MTTKTTKRALLMSVLSLVLCMSMLVGSTFAWFTDSASTGVNKIQSGILDVALEVSYDGGNTWENAEGKTLDFVKAPGYEDEDILWEPGCTYQLPMLRVVNDGNLWLKYQIAITGIKGDAKLNEAIEWSYNKGALDLVALNQWQSLAPAAASEGFIIKGHMKEDAGNEYQNLTIDGIGITVFATQKDAEYDSFDNKYDQFANRKYVTVTNQEELNVAIANATEPTAISLAEGTYNLLLKDGSTPNMVNKDIVFTGSKNAVMDLTGIIGATWHTQDTGTSITFDGVSVKWNEDNEGYQGFANAKKVTYKNCTIYGTQFMGGDAEFVNCIFEAANTDEKGYAVYGRGTGTLTFTDCTFNTDGRAIMLYQDQTTEINVVLNNCVFMDNGNYNSKDKAVVETGDGQYKTSKFNIAINNCTAYGFEANGSNSVFWGNKDNIPADRITITMTGTNTVGTYGNLDSAVTAGDANVYLPAGNYTLPALSNKTVVIVGTEDTVVDTSTVMPSTNGADITFDGVTVKFKEGGSYGTNGFTHSKKVVFKNCTIVGTQFLYASEGTEFINCTFLVEGDAYAVWTYGTNATFTDCTFNCDGKAVLVYTEGAVTNTVTFSNCVFNDNGAISGKAAVEIGESAYGNQANYTIILNDCTVNGFDTTVQNASTFGGTDLGTTAWGNKNLMPANRLCILINGIEVY